MKGEVKEEAKEAKQTPQKQIPSTKLLPFSAPTPHLFRSLFIVLPHRSPVLCWTWHDDHEIGRRLLLLSGGVSPDCGVPVLLDHGHRPEALLPRHHHTQLRRIRLVPVLPRLLSSRHHYQVPGSDGNTWVLVSIVLVRESVWDHRHICVCELIL